MTTKQQRGWVIESWQVALPNTAHICLILGLLSEGHTQYRSYIYLPKAASISSHTLETERQRERWDILIYEDWWRLRWILMRRTTTSSAAWKSLLRQAPRTPADDCLLCLRCYINVCLPCVCEACHFSIPCVHCPDFSWPVFALTSN